MKALFAKGGCAVALASMTTETTGNNARSKAFQKSGNAASKVFKTMGKAAALMLVAGCGGGLPSPKYAKVETYPIYGDMQRLAAKWDAIDSAIRAKREAELDKLKNSMNDKSSEEDVVRAFAKGKKIDAKYEEVKLKPETQKKAEVEAEAAKIIGRSMPFEFKEGTGYEVTSVKIVKAEIYGCDVSV